MQDLCVPLRNPLRPLRLNSSLNDHTSWLPKFDWHALRIIAGKYRGRKLKSPPSLETRPTSDRLRETLFNVLAPRIKSARFLDLCAGSGAVGIEALSRGAAHATFVDQSRKICALIEANLEAIGVDEGEVEVVSAEALEVLRRRAKKKDRPF